MKSLGNSKLRLRLSRLSLASLCLILAAGGLASDHSVDPVGPTLKLEKFVDPLPIPQVLRPEPGKPLAISETLVEHSFHRDLPAAKMWGFNGTFPGPTFEVQSGTPARILWKNELPNTPLFPNMAASGMNDMPGMSKALPAVRTVIHLHGASVSATDYLDPSTNSDGWPDTWNVPGGSQLATYPNTQPAMLLWYHDHAMGITAPNVYAGLAGMYVIRDGYEKSLNLPSGEFEIPLLLQGRSFNPDGSLYYPAKMVTEFYGNTNTVNGKIWPYLEVEPRKYRFRIVNGSNARTYALKLVRRNSNSQDAGPVFYQIGSDGGFLEKAVVLNDPKTDPKDPSSMRLILAPGERADLIIDFSQYAGQELVLNNNSQEDDESLEPAVPDVMLFRVKAKASSPDLSQIPVQMAPIAKLDETKSRLTRDILFSEEELPDGTQMLLMNKKHWSDPLSEIAVVNTIETWRLVNTTEDTHPFHIHLVEFQVLGRQTFDMDRYRNTGEVIATGPLLPPDPNESGWKDTVRASPGLITKVIMRFGPYTGHYVYHCHILEHEDMDMMRPIEVVPASSGS